MSRTIALLTSAAVAALAIAVGRAVLRGRYRRPGHQDQHQSVLRQDEGGLRGQGQGARPDAAGLCRQIRRRQRRRSQGDRAAYRRRRQGHPAGADNSTAIVPTVKKARAAGILVITLDTPLDPVDAADAIFATDNFKAGELIGEWAKGTLGDKAGTAKIATLDLTPNQPSVDYLRHNGFLTGFGITVKDPKHFATSDSPQIVGSDVAKGATEGGRKAMENILQKADKIDLVYAINEPAAYGGYAALKAAGKEKGVMIVAVDGGCQGVKWVKEGIIGATSQQYPLLMAADGVEAVAKYIKPAKKPNSIDTGEKLVTDHPVAGVPSINVDEGMKLCWG